MSRSLGRYDAVSHVDSVFLQMLLLERFSALAPAPVEYSTTVLGKAGVVNPRGAKSIYRAGALRWAAMKQSTDKSLAVVIDKEENL